MLHNQWGSTGGSYGFTPQDHSETCVALLRTFGVTPWRHNYPYNMSMYYCTYDDTTLSKELSPACQDASTCTDFAVKFPNISRGNVPTRLYLERATLSTDPTLNLCLYVRSC